MASQATWRKPLLPEPFQYHSLKRWAGNALGTLFLGLHGPGYRESPALCWRQVEKQTSRPHMRSRVAFIAFWYICCVSCQAIQIQLADKSKEHTTLGHAVCKYIYNLFTRPQPLTNISFLSCSQDQCLLYGLHWQQTVWPRYWTFWCLVALWPSWTAWIRC